MKPILPHDPLDELLMAALNGELSPEERARLEERIQNDPAVNAAFLEAQTMHDLLEKTNRSAQPDSGFEQRMVSGVRRKLKSEGDHPESAWESVLFFWRMGTRFLRSRWGGYATAACAALVILAVGLAAHHDKRVLMAMTGDGLANPANLGPQKIYLPLAIYKHDEDLKKVIEDQGINYVETARKGVTLSGYVDTSYTRQFAGKEQDLAAKYAFAGKPISGEIKLGAGGGQLETDQSRELGIHRLTMSAGDFTQEVREDNGPRRVFNTHAIDGTVKIRDGQTTVVAKLAPSTSPNVPIVQNVPMPGAENKSSNGYIRYGLQTFAAAAPTTPPPQTTATVSEVPVPQSTISGFSTGTPANQTRMAINEGATTVTAPTSAPSDSVAADSAGSGIPAAAPPASPALMSDVASNSDKTSDVGEAAPTKGTAWDQKWAESGKAEGKLQSARQEVSQPADNRKLIRNATLDLEVKSFQETVDKVTVLTKAAGGYVDTSHSEHGGNGKLQGTVVVKVLPQNLDAFLVKVRGLGLVQNLSVSTDDVTKDYFDTTARLENSRRMETQLQELLKHENGKVSDLLQVERELGRVRGDIESMQGQLKLYDFQVQYATVTMNVAEKDLNRAAAYLLKETDNFSLFATNVEDTFQKARRTAEDFKAQVLVANLNHNSGNDVSAEMTLSVAPEKIEPFLAEVRSMGRVANFTRNTQRVAKDGGDTDQPADQAQTEQDKVTVSLSIHSDDESRKQVALTVVTKAVDDALEKAKSAAMAAEGTEILSSSLNKAPEGQSVAQLSVRVPGKQYESLVAALKALGRVGSLSIQREDNAGPGASGDDAPVIVALSLTDSDSPLQVTEMAVRTDDVDAGSREIKRDAAAAGVEVKASSFERSPDGLEQAQMVFRMPMAKYAGFVESLKKLGKVESLSVRRDDRPDQTRADDSVPVEVSLQLHNQRGIVAADDGIFATMRRTFSDGASALFTSVRTIGVLMAFVLPWAVALGVAAWVGRRIYVWRKGK